MSRGQMLVVALVVLIAVLAIQSALRHPSTESSAPAAAQTAATPERPAAPELSLPLSPGQPAVALSSLKGKVVLLDFWATWCGPCRMSIPDLEKLYKKYHDQGLEVVGVSVDETADPVPAAVKELGMTYPVVMASDIPDVRSKFQFGGIPQMYLIDKQGRIGATYEGYDPSRDLETELKPFLKE